MDLSRTFLLSLCLPFYFAQSPRLSTGHVVIVLLFHIDSAFHVFSLFLSVYATRRIAWNHPGNHYTSYILPRILDLFKYSHTKARNKATCYFTTTSNGNLAPNETLRVCGLPGRDTVQERCKHGDTCSVDGFCYSPSPNLTPSPVYLGGCTDPQYQDDACTKSCGVLPVSFCSLHLL